MGKLIVFEGIDGSGKSTQYKLLCELLTKRGTDFRNITFPQYSEPSSALLKMYLQGDFGTSPADVNPYAASTFYAVDRYASYKKVWGGYYESGGLILTDRYTTSNAVHQASKLSHEERPAFYRWLYDFEFDKLGLPHPDAVLFFDINLETAVEHLRRRESETGTAADIHERDNTHLSGSITSANEASAIYGWHKIKCIENGIMRSVEDIHSEVIRVFDSLFSEGQTA
jgi:dTMP kinase